MKTQGRHGEVAAEVHSSVPDRFYRAMKLLALPPDLADRRRELEVEDFWPHKGLLVFKFVGVDSISDAEALVGCELQVPRNERSALEPGWNYVSDLIGCTVVDGSCEIGHIEDVRFGAGEAPLLVVRSTAAKVFEIPFAEAYIVAVDMEHRQVRMKLPEGLLEVNGPLSAEEKREQGRGRKH